MILLSAFNWAFDLDVNRGSTLFVSEFWFNFILMNLIFLLAYIYKDYKHQFKRVWYLVLIFCLYAFWDTDYFSFARNFYEGLDDFRDIIYKYIAIFSFGSYIIFRFFIWGTALLFYYLSLKKLRLNTNIGICIFAIFFLLTFSYARVSLGMASYFYGLIILFSKDNYIKRLVNTGLLFIIAYAAHRSMLVPIILTPLCYIKLDRKKVIIVACAIPFLIIFMKYILSAIVAGSIQDTAGDSEFASAAQGYTKLKATVEFNWKWELITTLRYYSFYVANIYILWKLYFKKSLLLNAPQIDKLTTISTIIILVAISILSIASNNLLGLWVVGYRYLYMAGIPICLILTYLYQHKVISKVVLGRLLLLPLLYAELFIAGKILTLQFLK